VVVNQAFVRHFFRGEVVVGRRTHEIGVRMALGAAPKNVLLMVLRQALELTLIGVGLGVAASLALTRLMRSMLLGVKPSDPATFLLVTCGADWRCTRGMLDSRATGDSNRPITALRYE
jgi:ABC-type antimicrobial peptide transport system permease subunit